MLKRIFLNDRLILVLIFLNAITIYAGGFYDDQSVSGQVLERIDNFFTLMFVVEAVVKMYYLTIKGYFTDRWNTFDFTLVMISVPSMLLWLIDPGVMNLEFLLVFRVLRIFKFFRVMRFIPNIESLLNGIHRALKSSVVIVIAFVACTLIVSFLSFSFFRDLSPEHFGNPLLAFYNTFKVFTIEGWYEVPDMIAEESEPFEAFLVRAYFVVLLFGGGIFGLALINSIFVQNMLEDNYEQGDAGRQQIRDDIAELKRLMKKLAEDKND